MTTTNKQQKTKSDGSTASYYELPPAASELQHLIAYKDMNAQIGEIFRASYRYGEVEHSEKLRDINKILFYAQAEKERLLKYELGESPKQTEEVKREPEQPPEPDEFPAPPRKPNCTVCENLITGRVYYLGNEPRCEQHSGS